MMVHINEMERKISEGTPYFDCFKGTELRRTEIVCVVWSMQALCGSALMAYSTTYFYQQAGLATNQSFNFSLVQSALGAFGTVFSWLLMTYCGRRTLYLHGMAVIFVLLLVVGFVSLALTSNTGASWAIGSMLLAFTLVYDCTVGQSATRLFLKFYPPDSA
ncbi:hypothetical protein V1517DRAFT_333709 [Lipomyces orientalis]|uniref:Uncharacterized protein n=1 Tax=Lipomyces orientalis TaxID=1233043 RepID=A0ACC3TDX5_9ASCO